jgi:hypothetical protein
MVLLRATILASLASNWRSPLMRVLTTLPVPPPSPFSSWTLPPTLEPPRRVMDRKPSLYTLPITRTPLATSLAPFSTLMVP